jgi:hypothetical protein
MFRDSVVQQNHVDVVMKIGSGHGAAISKVKLPKSYLPYPARSNK